MSSHESRLEYRGIRIYQTPEEIENLRKLVREISTIDGDMAEVGVFEGASAAIIREESKDRKLYLFDTFEGFPNNLDDSDCKAYFVGDCKANSAKIVDLMKGEKEVYIITGKFPDTGDVIKDHKFAFVHIDVDIYNSTKEALEFFLPKMVKGGVILIHDYPVHTGVKKAVDELGIEIEVLGMRQAVWRKT